MIPKHFIIFVLIHHQVVYAYLNPQSDKTIALNQKHEQTGILQSTNPQSHFQEPNHTNQVVTIADWCSSTYCCLPGVEAGDEFEVETGKTEICNDTNLRFCENQCKKILKYESYVPLRKERSPQLLRHVSLMDENDIAEFYESKSCLTCKATLQKAVGVAQCFPLVFPICVSAGTATSFGTGQLWAAPLVGVT